jgi:hypothetical protein
VLKISSVKRIGSLLTFLASTASAQLAAEPVRFDYRAPPGCPDGDSFRARVDARTKRARVAEPGELARNFVVEVRADGAGAMATLSFSDSRGAPVVRAVRGETCDEVVSAIALVTALAIEAGTTEAGSPRSAAPQQPKAATPARADPPAEMGGKRTPRAPEPDVLAVLVGAETGVTTWLGPSPSLGIGVFGELGRYAGASGRLTLLRATSHALVALPDDASTFRGADFTALVARIEGCPLAAALGSGFRAVPCLGLGLGALEGAGDRATIDNPERRSIPWADLVPALRVDWTLADSLVFFLEGELGIPLRRHDFVLHNPDQTVFTVPTLGAGVSFGMAWRFE